MSYILIYSAEASKNLKKLDKNISSRIISTLERIKTRPFLHVTKLVGSDHFRLRVGDYRVIMDIFQDKLIILVVEVGHRKSIYK